MLGFWHWCLGTVYKVFQFLSYEKSEIKMSILSEISTRTPTKTVVFITYCFSFNVMPHLQAVVRPLTAKNWQKSLIPQV